ncbi:MAG: FixH family protein [Burkholderiaceae bacterium]
MTDARLNPPCPWYRQAWPWLLMIMPATAFFGGIFTWWLAATTNNSLVVDDYYREGRAINQQLARDDAAAQMGLSATLRQDGGIALQLSGRMGEAGLPDTLSLRLVHATDAALDAGLQLNHAGDGLYRAAGALPAGGHWIVHLEEPQRRWRLIARTDHFAPAITLSADPVGAGGPR